MKNRYSVIKEVIFDKVQWGLLVNSRFSYHNAEQDVAIYANREELAAIYVDFQCNCGNPEMGFECACDWMRENPGDTQWACEYCGIYTASKPRCNKCGRT